MQKEWFKVSSHKTSSSAHVESYLKMIQNVSWDLRKKIVNAEDANVSSDLVGIVETSLCLKWRFIVQVIALE